MQKIIIKNFGAIEYAEIEIKKVLVLIGEQASGKSTIAKLIYFFKSLRDDIFKKIYLDQESVTFSQFNDIDQPLAKKFAAFFGSTSNLPDFEIRYYYNLEEEKYLNLSVDVKKIDSHILKKVKSKFSPNFFSNEFKTTISNIKVELNQNLNAIVIGSGEEFIQEQKKIQYINKLRFKLIDLFNSRQTNLLFIIAGRNLTVSYSELFEKYLFTSVQDRLEQNRLEDSGFNPRTLTTNTIDEILMLEFIERVIKIKNIFRRLQSFDGVIKSATEFAYDGDQYVHETQELNFIKKKLHEILKGEYIFDNLGEKIIVNSKMSVNISNASSGQQDVIRLLQDIFICIIERSQVLRIVEEPEAHLFPVAQKSLIELLALMVNQKDDNQLIITTHSPYVLTVFNNLLFAQRVVDKNPSAEAEVAELIPKEFWLDPNEFSAYSLGNSSIEEEPEYCESIFNQQTGAIKQNYLDAVSEMLGGDFNALYSIYTKNSRRR
ncbi:MAG: ATP-binding protein [Pseudanabaena sp. 42896M_M3]|jgi:predicted ATPase|nr:ATP-binding protein [Pseudanabaena sp. 42896M_M3]